MFGKFFLGSFSFFASKISRLSAIVVSLGQPPLLRLLPWSFVAAGSGGTIVSVASSGSKISFNLSLNLTTIHESGILKEQF